MLVDSLRLANLALIHQKDAAWLADSPFEAYIHVLPVF